MRKLISAAVLAAFAVPAFADGEKAAESRLAELESVVITSIKDEPAAPRLGELENIVITAIREDPERVRLEQIETIQVTAPKAQPADYEVGDKTAALLAEIEKEKK